MQVLHDVFEKLQAERLFARRKNCFFGKMSVKYLGHIVEAGGLCADPDKVEAILCTWLKLWYKSCHNSLALLITTYCYQAICQYCCSSDRLG